MFPPRPLFCSLALIGAGLFCSPASGQSYVLYREAFPNNAGADIDLTTSSWRANRGAAGTSVTATVANSLGAVDWVGMPTNLPGVNNAEPASLAGVTVRGLLSDFGGTASNELFWTDEFAISQVLRQVTQIRFYLGNSSTPTAARVALRAGGNWYVSNQTFSMGTGITVDNFGTQAEEKVLAFGGASWNALNFVQGTALSIGASTTLSAGDITAFGIYMDNNPGGERMRFDSYEITVLDLPTATSTVTPTCTATPTSTASPTDTPTHSPSPTPSRTPTDTPTGTPTASPTPSESPTHTWTGTSSPTSTSTWTLTRTETRTASFSPTPTGTASPTDTPTETGTQTPTRSPSHSPTRSATRTDSPTPSPSPSPSASPSVSVTGTPSATASPTAAAFVSFRIYSSSGALVAILGPLSVSSPPADFSFSVNPYRISGDPLMLAFGPGELAWAGRDGQGQDLPSGAYRLVMVVTEAATGQELGRVEHGIVLIRGPEAETGPLSAYPNPLAGSGAILSVRVGLADSLSSLAATIYDVSGEAVCRRGAVGPVWTWDLRNDQGQKVSEGMYVILVRIQDSKGRREIRLLRVVILGGT